MIAWRPGAITWALCPARGSWLEFCASNDVEPAELIECALASDAIKPSHCGKPIAPLGYVTEGSIMADPFWENDMLELLS
jgi:hypothetical protein